jgi:transcriptional regulator with XRE-family HTH domain
MDFVFQTLQAQGRTQRWLARQLGIDPSLLTKYKSGARVAPEHVVRRSCELLGLPYSAALYPSGNISSPAGRSAA